VRLARARVTTAECGASCLKRRRGGCRYQQPVCAVALGRLQAAAGRGIRRQGRCEPTGLLVEGCLIDKLAAYADRLALERSIILPAATELVLSSPVAGEPRMDVHTADPRTTREVHRQPPAVPLLT
jgi:hypothetical protein